MEFWVHSIVTMAMISDGRYVQETGGHLNVNNKIM